MYSVGAGSILQVILMGKIANQRWMNVIHYKSDGVDPSAIEDGELALDEAKDILDAAGSGWSFLRGVYTSTAMEIEWIQLQWVTPTRYAYKRYLPDTTAGTQVGDEAPPNVAIATTYQTDETGPGKQSVMHIAGVLASDVTDGMVPALIRGHMQSEADFLIEPWTLLTQNTSLWSMVVFDRAVPANSEIITHATPSTTSRVLRRRTVGLGA